MENQKANGFIVTLVCKNEELYRLNTSDFVEEISIGRDATCTWSVGHADTSVSNRHAILSRRKKEFYLTDLGSLNGMFCNGSRVKEVRLAPGMSIQFGSCILTVSTPGSKKGPTGKPHILKYMDDRGKIMKVRLHPGTMKIGGAEKYDIFLNSPLVSSPHASVIGKNDGSFWIKDLNSRNGTSVNHTELPPKTERMLKHGDLISIADVDMTYYDPTARKEGVRLTFALFTLVVSIIACGCLYFAWQQMRPSAEALIEKARTAARLNDFKQARELLISASSAKNASALADKRRLLLTRISTWEHSATTWNALKTVLAKDQFGLVPQLLGSLDLRSVAAWDWNEQKAVEEKRKAEFVKNTFAAMGILDSTLNNPEATREQLSECIAQLQKVQARFPEFQDNYMKGFKALSKKMLTYAVYTRKQLELLEKRVQAWENDSLDAAAEAARFEKIAKQAPSVLAARLEKLLPLLYSLKKAQEQLLRQEKLITSLRFSECAKEKTSFPQNTLSIKAIDRLIGKIRKQDAKYKDVAWNLEVYYNVLKWDGAVLGKPYLALRDLSDPNKMRAVFACDSLKLPYPVKKRVNPSGFYDEIAGIEYLFATLMMIKTYEPVRSRYDIQYSPKLEKVSGVLSIMSHFVKLAEREIAPLAKQGELKKYLTYLKEHLNERDRIVASLQSRMKDNTTREYFIAHGIAFALNAPLYSVAKRAQLHKELSDYRSALQKQNSEYNAVLPEEAIKIREAVLNKGIPGDPIVKRMWSLR